MGVKCPRCRSNNTRVIAERKLRCEECAYSWKRYKHAGKRMKTVGDGIIYPKKRVMPGANTESIGDDIIFPKTRVKKKRKKNNWPL